MIRHYRRRSLINYSRIYASDDDANHHLKYTQAYIYIQGVPEKNAQSLAHDKFGTIRRKIKFFCTKMFGKDYCLPMNAKFV